MIVLNNHPPRPPLFPCLYAVIVIGFLLVALTSCTGCLTPDANYRCPSALDVVE